MTHLSRSFNIPSVCNSYRKENKEVKDLKDWAAVQKVYCFAMILSASRKKAVCFSLKVDAEAIYEAIQELYDELGGVTLELLIDNPKALVLENNPRSEEEIKYNPHALMLAKHLGTELNACPCYWPRKKGKIESPFKYIENQFIKGNSFLNMEDLNRRVKQNVDEWCNEKHSTTKRIPNQHYLLEERELLLPLPKSRYRTKKMQNRKISPDSFVSINSNKYSVPVQYVGKNIQFCIIYSFRIELYDLKGNHIMSFEQLDKKHQTLSNPAHYEAITPKVSTSIPQIRRDFTQQYSNGSRYLEAAGRKFDQSTHYARRIMELQELYSLDVMDCLIGITVDRDQMDIKGFKKLLKEYNDGTLILETKTVETEPTCSEPESALTRECSYYEEICKGDTQCKQ